MRSLRPIDPARTPASSSQIPMGFCKKASTMPATVKRIPTILTRNPGRPTKLRGNWEWQAADAAMSKARLGRPDWSESHRPRQIWGEAESLGRGRWRAACSGRRWDQRPYTKLLAAMLEGVVVERIVPTQEAPQRPCLDKAYDNPAGWEAITTRRIFAGLARRS